MKTLVDKIYQIYGGSAPSLFRSFYHECLRSRFLTRLIFGMNRFPIKTGKSCYFDLTTLLLCRELKKLARRWENPRMLEIGTGSFAILSGNLSKQIGVTIDGVDNAQERIERAKQFIAANGFKVNAISSDVFSNLPKTPYDLIFWNLPYYRDPCYLDALFGQAHDYLTPGGLLVIGYNSMPLSRSTILSYLKTKETLQLDRVVAYFWNRHEILLIKKKP